MNTFDECAYEILKDKPEFSDFEKERISRLKYGVGVIGIMFLIAVSVAYFDHSFAFLFVGMFGVALIKYVKNLYDAIRKAPPKEVFYGKVLKICPHKVSKKEFARICRKLHRI